ncbi:hypothetical protein AAFN86_25790 [Roseomonas sp. CAU 1739]|uniref:hypothetical protein n=1 Tax=Roseomonas sp. CAU 1739 TaxID=3140364 RepID=UPI00325C238C
MSAPGLAHMAKCRFITLYSPPGMVGNGGFEAFIWMKASHVPQCDVDYVAQAIREAHAAGHNFYLFFQHGEARDTFKDALTVAGIVAARAVVQ